MPGRPGSQRAVPARYRIGPDRPVQLDLYLSVGLNRFFFSFEVPPFTFSFLFSLDVCPCVATGGKNNFHNNTQSIENMVLLMAYWLHVEYTSM